MAASGAAVWQAVANPLTWPAYEPALRGKELRGGALRIVPGEGQAAGLGMTRRIATMVRNFCESPSGRTLLILQMRTDT
jgi:hypothetical protein